MYVELEFDTPPDGLEVTHLSRLLLDLQHLMVVATALARPRIGPSDPAVDTWLRSYKGMVEAGREELLDTVAHVSLIQQQSPLTIGIYLREVSGLLKSKAEAVLNVIFERFFYGDLERERRRVQIDSEREDVRQKRIETLSKTFDLVERIGDPDLRREFVDSLDSAIRPFQEDHPPIRRAEVTERPRRLVE